MEEGVRSEVGRLSWSTEVTGYSCHIYYSERAMEIPDGRTKWAGLDKNSEELNDMGELKEEEEEEEGD